jgi:hypothetical protein
MLREAYYRGATRLIRGSQRLSSKCSQWPDVLPENWTTHSVYHCLASRRGDEVRRDRVEKHELRSRGVRTQQMSDRAHAQHNGTLNRPEIARDRIPREDGGFVAQGFPEVSRRGIFETSECESGGSLAAETNNGMDVPCWLTAQDPNWRNCGRPLMRKPGLKSRSPYAHLGAPVSGASLERVGDGPQPRTGRLPYSPRNSSGSCYPHQVAP